MDKRRYPRIPVSNVTADVSDGSGFFFGQVVNISEIGVLLEDVPKKINSHAKSFSLIIFAKGKNFKVLAQSQWVQESDNTKNLGLNIFETNLDWINFINKLQPQKVDVWAASNLRA
jgi:hypothetical protein